MTNKRISFHEWSARRSIPSHHQRGMLAFLKDKEVLLTIEEWDALFANY